MGECTVYNLFPYILFFSVLFLKNHGNMNPPRMTGMGQLQILINNCWSE